MSFPILFKYVNHKSLSSISCHRILTSLLLQVETLAQFGSIFLLFCHGMMYSQHYHVSQLGGVMPDTFAAGVLILSAIFFLTIIVYTLSAGSTESKSQSITSLLLVPFCSHLLLLCGVPPLTGHDTYTVYSATLVASAVSLSSTTTTAHSLVKSKLRETAYGKALIELMAVQVRR